MIVVTTPMCKQIVEWAGLIEFKINKHPDMEKGDLAILLSESKTEMDSLTVKLNTFSQIKKSITKVSNYCFKEGLIEKEVSKDDILNIFKSYDDLRFVHLDNDEFNQIRNKYSNITVKVYSEFLKDIVSDIGANIVNFSVNDLNNSSDYGSDCDSDYDNECGNNILRDYDFVVFPDYLKNIVENNENRNSSSIKFIEVPTHTNVSKDPIIRAEERYSLLVNSLKID